MNKGKQHEKINNQLVFETENSQDVGLEDRDFAPWVRRKTKKNDVIIPKRYDNHKFLANIQFKHRKNESQGSPEKKEQISKIRKNIESKIEAQKVQNDYIELMKANRKSLQQKALFQKRSPLNIFHKKPKYIELKLDFDPSKELKSPYNGLPTSVLNSSEIQRRRESNQVYPFRKKEKSKEESKGQKQFGETMKDFHQNIFSPSSKMYRTLDLNVHHFSQPKRVNDSGRMTSYNEQRPKISSLHKRNKPFSRATHREDKIQTAEMACEGKNLLATSINNSRRERIKKQFKEQQMRELIFLK